jgi:hypothetical protein
VGWTAFDVADTSFAMALERCDQSLYAAKDGGRNCVRPLLRTGRPSDSVFGALWV